MALVSREQYILKVLMALQSTRPPAQKLIAVVQKGNLSGDTLDALVQACKNALNSVKDITVRKKLQATINILERIKQAESADRQREAVEIQQLEQIFATMEEPEG